MCQGGRQLIFSNINLLTKEGIVGVDIGSSAIKIVRAEPSKQGAHITNVAMCQTPPECIRDGVISNVAEMASTIRNCMRIAGIKAVDAVTSVAGPGVIVRQIQLHTMPEKVLRKSLRFEASKYISASLDDSMVEFDILGPAQVEGQMNVILAAAPRAMVESKVMALEQAGLDPIGVDVEVFASLRTLIDYSRDKFLAEGAVALLDIGASHSEINLVCKGKLELSRTIPIAGDSLTNAIMTAKSCNLSEALKYKHEADMSILIDAPPGTKGNSDLLAVQTLIDELLREVRRSVNYYQSQLPEGATDTVIDALILSGGTARLIGLAPYVQSRLHLDVRVGNPALVDLIQSSSENEFHADDSPLISVAFGLAAKEMSITAKDESVAA